MYIFKNIHVINNQCLFVSMAGDRMHLAYYPTHCRMGAWLIGVYAGYVLHSIRGKSVIIPKVSENWLF